MDDRIRNKLYVGKSARDFLNQHPSEIEGHAAVAAELNRTVTRMDEVLAQFETGKREAAAAHREQARLVGVIQEEFLLPIAAIARGNSSLDPGIPKRFRAPNRSGDKPAYIGAARSIMALAEEHKAVFIRDAMPDSFVGDLGKTLDEYAAAATVVNNNRQLHVQARSELQGLARQLMAQIKRLDGIHRTQFRKEPHLFQAWMAARNVAWPVVNQKQLQGGKQEKPAA